MRRYLAVVIALSVCALQAQAEAFHVHRVGDHDPDERHAHGPAIHQHQRHHSESNHRVRLIEHDDTTSVVTLTMPQAVQFYVASADGPVAEVASFEPALEFVQRMVVLDVRSHGPPSPQPASYRGPPVSPPA